MGFYIAAGPDGAKHGFQIKGDQPDDKEMQWIDTTLNGKGPQTASTSEPGLLQSFGSGIMAGGNKMQAAGDIMVSAFADNVLRRPDIAKQWQELAKAQQAEGASYPVQDSFWGGMAESAGETLPSLAGTALAAAAAPETAGASLGAVPFLVGAGTMAPVMLSDNAQRQFEEHGEIKDWTKLAAATAAQTGIEFTTDLLTGHVAGVVGKLLPKDVIRKAVDGGINKGFTALVRKVGEPTAAGIINGALEEVSQQGLERWQADLPLLDEQARAEYIQSAIGGAIFEGAFGSVLGGYNAYQEGKFDKAMRDAKADDAAETAAAQGKINANYQTYEQQRRQPYVDPAPPPVAEQPKAEPITDPRLMLPDFSTPSTEQRALDKETTPLPQGLREQDDAPVEEMQGPLFTESDYRRAVDAMRGRSYFAPGQISMTLQMKKPKAEAIYAEMLRRNDAYPAGSRNQYARVTVPLGMPTRSGSDVRGTTPDTAKPGQTVRVRDYTVKPVLPAGAKPFTVKVNGKKRGKTLAFPTRSEAESFVSQMPENIRKNATVEEDTSQYQHGVFEQSYEHMPNREQRLVGERVVNTFKTREEADAAREGYDKRYSPETNKAQEKLTDEQKNQRISDDFKRQTGPLVDLLQKIANGIFGDGRGEIRVAPTIDKAYLDAHGIKHDFPDNTVVEGMAQRRPPDPATTQKVMRSLITLNHALTDPNATEEQKAATLRDVFNHEAVHVLRHLDLLKPEEWNSLLDAAINTKVPGKSYTYIQREIARPNAHQLPVNHLAEEAMANMARTYMRDPGAFKSKPAGNILGKIAQFIRRIVGLSRRHPAQDLMDHIFKGGVAARPTGYGGMMPRGPDDAMYSVMVPDNFYLGTERFLQGITIEKQRGQQWWKILKNAGLKPNEMEWLGLNHYLTQVVGNDELDKRDLLNYVRAASPKVKTIIRSENPDLRDWSIGKPKWPQFTIPGITNLTEVAFTVPPQKGQPDFPGNYHVADQYGKPVDNVLAFTRFGDVHEDGKKILNILEMQSDLHQKASQLGGYFSETAVRTYQQKQAALTVLEEERKSLYAEGDRLIKEYNALGKKWRDYERDNKGKVPWRVYRDVVDAINEEIDANMERRMEIRERENEIDGDIDQAREGLDDVRQRLNLPNAPFKTQWEDYVIKRLVRHAIENGYDGIAWHGVPESIIENENYQNVKQTVNDKGQTEYHQHGPNNELVPQRLTPIFNRYLVRLPRVVNQLVQPFGAEVNHSPASPDAAQKRAEFNEASKGANFPTFDNYEDFDQYFPEKASVKNFARRLESQFNKEKKGLGADDREQAQELLAAIQHIAQRVIQAREYVPHEAFDNLNPNDIAHAWLWLDLKDFVKARQIVQPAPWDDPIASGVTNDQTFFPYQHYRLMFNDRMMEGYERGDIPMFSALAPQSERQPQYAANAPLGQRVPAAPTMDRLSQIHNRMTYNNIAPWLEKAFGWAGVDYVGTKAFGTSGDVAKRASEGTIIALQDKMLSVAKMVDRMKRNDGFITGENDPYLQATLFPGKVDEEIKRNNIELVEPLGKAIKAMDVNAADIEQVSRLNPDAAELVRHYRDSKKTDPRMTMAEIGIYALHAKERNLEMRKRNEKVFQATGARLAQWEAGSGMTDDHADEIINWIGHQRFAAQLIGLGPNSVRTRFRALIANTNDVRFRAGLNPDFRTMLYANGDPVDPYKDYAPLRGFINEAMHPDEQTREFARTGKGFMIRGKEDYAAIGRALPVAGHPGVFEPALAGNLIATAALQNREAVVRAGKNEVDKALYRLIEQHPAEFEDQAEIMQTPRMKYGYDRRSQSVRLINANMQLMSDPTVLKLKIDGEQKFIKLKDPALARAMNETASLGQTGLTPLLNGLLRLNRVMAALRTSWNPEFVITNLMRDMGGAMVNIGEQQASGLRRQVVKSVMPAWKGIWNVESGKAATSQWEKDYQEFKAHGGQSAFYGAHELGQTLEQFNKQMAADYSGAPQKAWGGVKAIFGLIEKTNTAIENGTRLAAYTTLRDYYLTQTSDPTNPANIKRAREMAALAAKNMTVNFNAAGSAKPVLNALYLFFNASIQGSAALINPFIRSKKIRAMWIGAIIAGAAQDLLMSALMPDDDDGKSSYDKIPDYVLEKNIVLPNPLLEKGYFKIPLPYLMNGLWNWGRAAARTARGGYTVGEFLKSGGVTMLDSLNPFGGSNSFLNFVAPSILDPVVDLYQNEDWTGRPIAPAADPYGVQENASQRYWNNTSPWAITVADWMSRLTGRQGDYIPGVMEWSPNQVEYVTDFLTGGTGQFLSRAINLMSGQEDRTASDIPFVRGITGQVSSREDMGAYIEGRDKVLAIRQSIKAAQQQGDTEASTGLMRLYPQEYRASIAINKIENARKKIMSSINKIRDNSRIPDDQKEAMIARLKARRDELVASGNKVLQEMRQ